MSVENDSTVPLKVVEVVASLTRILGDDPDHVNADSGLVRILWHLPVALRFYKEAGTLEVEVSLDDASRDGQFIENRDRLYAAIGFCTSEGISVST